jgi:hypothetical protein
MVLIAEEPRRAATVTALDEAEMFAVYRAEFERLRCDQPGSTNCCSAMLCAAGALLTREGRLIASRLF